MVGPTGGRTWFVARGVPRHTRARVLGAAVYEQCHALGVHPATGIAYTPLPPLGGILAAPGLGTPRNLTPHPLPAAVSGYVLRPPGWGRTLPGGVAARVQAANAVSTGHPAGGLVGGGDAYVYCLDTGGATTIALPAVGTVPAAIYRAFIVAAVGRTLGCYTAWWDAGAGVARPATWGAPVPLHV